MAKTMLIGRKIGMTRIFNEIGRDIPVTVVTAGPCTVVQIKNEKNDGYSGIQIGFENKKDKHTTKPSAGHFKKAGAENKRYLKEFVPENGDEYSIGDKITVDSFEVGDDVDVRGTSKGKGFAGVMKRHGFSGGRQTHGKNSVMRAGGSVGASASPSRIFPGMKMPGRMGGNTVCTKNLTIVRIDSDNNQLFIKGAVPGGKNGVLFITK